MSHLFTAGVNLGIRRSAEILQQHLRRDAHAGLDKVLPKPQ